VLARACAACFARTRRQHPVRLDLGQPVPQLVTHNANSHRHGRQISPNKNMSLQRATATFTLSTGPGGLRHLVLTRPETEPSMRFLFVGSHLCARAPSDKPSRTCPCRRLIVILTPSGPPTGDSHPISSCPCRAYTIGFRGCPRYAGPPLNLGG
jgi:hypothetical protein